MDAGVPIKAPVAGISCGLITAEDGSFMTMIDIQGLEDFYGDMDFKVAGTHKGITSIQMDLKIDGLTPEIIKEALAVTHKGRDYIIDNVILAAIDKPRTEVSKYAPKMLTMHIDPEKSAMSSEPAVRSFRRSSQTPALKLISKRMARSLFPRSIPRQEMPPSCDRIHCF